MVMAAHYDIIGSAMELEDQAKEPKGLLMMSIQAVRSLFEIDLGLYILLSSLATR